MQRIFYLLLISLILTSCKKEANSSKSPMPVFTEGVALGLPIKKEIGPAGGVIEIQLAKAKLIFPAESVLSTTSIIAQPITNTLSNLGVGIRLSSDYKKAILVFDYSNLAIKGKTLSIYYMNTGSPGLGWFKAENIVIDTLAQTISTTQTLIPKSAKISTHSSDYVLAE
jgi:hypothetical protein